MNTKPAVFVFGRFLFLSAMLLSPGARADFTHDKCAHVLLGSGEIQVSRNWDVESGVCSLDLHPRNVVDLKFRDFYFDNLGHFMVFNSYGEGPDSQMTAARDFFIFPIIEDYPDFSIETNGDVTVKMVSGHLFRVSAQDFSIVSLTPGTVQEKKLSSTNQGGVEFQLQSGFWIDGGFKKGASRMSNPKVASVIKSSKSVGASCTVLNKDLLNYPPDGNYVLKYEKEKLASYLQTKCAKMQF